MVRTVFVVDLQPIFFFKQKTAYELGVRLVGSEMCIRDSRSAVTASRENARSFASGQVNLINSDGGGFMVENSHVRQSAPGTPAWI